MTPYHAKLGVALTGTASPITTQNGDGGRAVIWPAYANGLLLVGNTGNGKSSLLRWLTYSIGQTNRPKAVHMADGKFSGGFLMFSGVPWVANIANTPTEIAALVRFYFGEVEDRYAKLSAARTRAQQTRTKPEYQTPGDEYLILDEYLNWVLALSDRDRRDVIAKLVRIGSIGREVRCRLVIATQRPGTKDGVDTGLPGFLKGLLGCRVAASGMLGLTRIEARMAFDEESYTSRMPEAKAGHGFVQVGPHELGFRTPWLADPTDPDTSDRDRRHAWDLLFPPKDSAP